MPLEEIRQHLFNKLTFGEQLLNLTLYLQVSLNLSQQRRGNVSFRGASTTSSLTTCSGNYTVRICNKTTKQTTSVCMRDTFSFLVEFFIGFLLINITVPLVFVV